MRLFRRLYGASPWHLAIHLAAFALIGWALVEAFHPGYAEPANLAGWLIGGDVAVDLLLLPAYSLVDLGLRRALGARRSRPGRPGRDPRRVAGVTVVNHVRVPAAAAAALLLVYLPLILAKSRETYIADSGHPPPDHALRWALVSLAFFVASAVVLAVRIVRARRAAGPAPTTR